MALAVTGYRFSWVCLENENNTLEYIQFISFWCKNAKQTFFFFSTELILYSCSYFFSTTLRNNFSLENLMCVFFFSSSSFSYFFLNVPLLKWCHFSFCGKVCLPCAGRGLNFSSGIGRPKRKARLKVHQKARETTTAKKSFFYWIMSLKVTEVDSVDKKLF